MVAALTGGKGRPAAFVLMLLVGAAFVLWGAEGWRPMRNFVFDAYQRAFPRKVERFPVVVVDIDEASLAALGRWPWPRTRLAQLTQEAHRLGAMAVGYDIIMPEPDSLSPDVILAFRPDVGPLVRQELAALPSNDELLAQTLRQTPSVVARAALIDSDQAPARESRQTSVMVVGESPVSHVTRYGGHLTNIAEIENAAFGCGYLNDTRDPDGVVRSMPVVIAVGGRLAPSLSLELLRTAVGANWYSVHATPDGLSGVQIGDSFIPTDPDGRIRLYFSPAYAMRRVSALSVFRGKVEADAFAQKVAIVGVTGVGTIDVASTPVAARMDGVEVQAQVVENILAGCRLIRPRHARWVELGIFAVIGLLFIALVPRAHPGIGILLFLALAAATGAASISFFLQSRILYDPSFPVAADGLLFVWLLTAGFADSYRRQRELDAALEAEKLERVRISGELQAAREIQMGMLPAPGAIKGLSSDLDFYALLEPAEQVGGDLYDAFMIDDRHFFFLVGDVAGKGVAASLFMALSKTLCKSSALRGYTPLEELMTKINMEISRENPAMLFVTALAGILDVVDGTIELCSAGHDVPVLLRPGEVPASVELQAGPPLCVLEDFSYVPSRLALQAGDMLVLISDGITEAQDPEQELYGRKRAIDALAAISGNSAETVCLGLYDNVKKFVRGASQSDDITILAVGWRSGL